MSIIKPKRIEDYILNHLQKGSVLTLDLVKKIQEDRPKTTKQAVYAALRSLKKQEQVLTVKGFSFLNVTWINQMVGFFEFSKSRYVQEKTEWSFLDLEDKERIKYYFRDAHKADVFWTHAYYLLMENMALGEPVFLYNPHEWFLLARNENERAVIRATVGKGYPFLMTAGGSTFLDKHVRKYYDGDKSQYNPLEKSLFEKNNYYINIFGDFLIEVWLDEKIAEEIDSLYKTCEEWNENIAAKFAKVLDREGRMRIVISRNKKKAEKIKRSLRKGFALKIN